MKTKIAIVIMMLSLILGFSLSACDGAEEVPTQAPVERVSPENVVAEGHLLPIQSTWLNFGAQGRVGEILVAEGEVVVKDQVLMRLADREQAEASLLAAELELARAQQDLDEFLRTAKLATANAWRVFLDSQVQRAEAERRWEDLDLDSLEEEVDDAMIEVFNREDDLADAQEELEKYAGLDETNFSRQAAEDDLEEAQEDYNEAQRDLEEAIRAVDVFRADLDSALAAEAEAKRTYEMWLNEGVDLDQQTLLETRVSAAKAGIVAAQNALDNFSLTAPFAGTVTDIYLEIGQFIGPDVTAVQIGDLREFKIETSDLTELEVIKISEGQMVEIVPDALPDLQLSGKVEQISQSFRTQAGDIIYTVTIKLEETNPSLRWGMTLEITFITD